MNNKGFVKTLEAIVAVIIVFTLIVTLAPTTKKQREETPDAVKQAQAFLLDQITSNEIYRECVKKSAAAPGECKIVCPSPSDIDSFVKNNIPSQYDYRCEICLSASTCSGPPPLDKSLYTDSRLVAADPPRVVRVIIWEK